MAGQDDFTDLVGDVFGEGTGDAPQDQAKDDKAPDTSKNDETGGGEGGNADDNANQNEDGNKDASKNEGDDDDADDSKDASKDQMVPKKALDAEKRRRREMTARLKRIEERFAAVDAEVARASIPDPVEDPKGHAAYVENQQETVRINEKLNFSEYHARKTHGEDAVSAAFEWASAQMEDPANGKKFAQTLFAHADPYDFAVDLHKKALAAQPGTPPASSDPEYAKFLAWKAAQEPAADNAARPNQEQPKPRPTSLAQRSSAAGDKGKEAVVDPFDSEFSR